MSGARLSERLAEATCLEELRSAVAAGRFPGITLAHAIQFARSDGLLPANDLPAQSFLDLEDWLLGRRSALRSADGSG